MLSSSAICVVNGNCGFATSTSAHSANHRSTRGHEGDSGCVRSGRGRFVQPYENQIIIAGMLYKNLCNCRLIHCGHSDRAHMVSTGQ